MRRIGVIVTLVSVLAATAAAKPPTAAERKAAKAHFDQGRAYYEAGGYDDAIREYEAAYTLMPMAELQFNIAQAYRLKNDKPQAIAAYQRYLDASPDGALADEARNHVAALKLKIQVEEAEAARKKAMDEADAARRRADEAEAARKRIEAEAARRVRTQREDEERLRRVAAEEAEAARVRKEAAEAAYQRRLEDAGGRGQALRVLGTVSITVGALTLVSMSVPFVIGDKAKSKLDEFNQSSGSGNGHWTTELDSRLQDIKTAQTAMLALGITGGSLVLTGIVLRIVGSARRSNAEERVRAGRVSLVPTLTPAGPGLVLGGRF
ncbi:MAG TPA: tetratricopeptide repeat protein [Polyangia bacterium]|jgi:tetratricopeptide (TPR) repeat protein